MTAGCVPIEVDLADFTEADRAKGMAALGRVELEEVIDPDSAAFAEAYAMLDGYFGSLGEIEPVEVFAERVRERELIYGEDLGGTYHLVTARADGRLVGVRDAFVDVDRRERVALAVLSHSFVVPEWRRRGLAALFRTLPASLARAADRRRGESWPTLMVAEMEPADPSDPATVVRLIAYGRSGFGVLDPRVFRYSQPEMRDLPRPTHTALPLLGLVRSLDRPTREIPAREVACFPRLFYTCHRDFLPAERVDPSDAHAALHLAGVATVPVLSLPVDTDTLDRLAPLMRGAVLPLYPPGLRGPDPRFGDPAEELRALKEAWSRL